MITMLKNWNGKVQLNGTIYNSVEDLEKAGLTAGSEFHLILLSDSRRQIEKAAKAAEVEQSQKTYRITVKKYMTRPTEYDEFGNTRFDFMKKWNNDVPMPLRTMVGTIDKQTPGMYHMTLHGDIYAQKICTCMKCGRKLDNPVSQYFGIGPECGGHGYVNPFDDEDQLKAAVEEYKAKLQNVTWSGWIIKSAITEMEEV